MPLARELTDAADLIGKAVTDGLFIKDDRILVVDNPSEKDQLWFNVLLDNGTLHFEDVGKRRLLMIKSTPGISTGLNLNTGKYALGAKRLEPGLLFLARQLSGWENPTGKTEK